MMANLLIILFTVISAAFFFLLGRLDASNFVGGFIISFIVVKCLID